MGTHAAMGITDKQGSHTCVERTLDGYYLLEVARDILKDVLTNEEEIKISDWVELVGNGSVEFNDEREHNQTFFLHINYQKKELTFSQSPYIVEKDGSETLDVDLLYALHQRGWKCKEGLDCCEG